MTAIIVVERVTMHLPKNNIKSPAEFNVVNLTTLFMIVLKAWKKKNVTGIAMQSMWEDVHGFILTILAEVQKLCPCIAMTAYAL